jgi:penicillin amidase
MIEAAPEPITLEYVQQMQGDNKDQLAEALVPIVLALPLPQDDEDVAKARNLFSDWDYQAGMDLAAPALFSAFWRNLLAATFHDDLPQDYWPDGGSRWAEVIRKLVEQPDSPWWDNQTTTTLRRQEIFTRHSSRQLVNFRMLWAKTPNIGNGETCIQ